MLRVDANFDKLIRQLSDVGQKQLPFALSQALNDTAGEIDDAWQTLMDRKIDHPTPFTKRGIYTRRSSKSRLVSEVGFKDIQAGYLERLVDGGVRTPSGRAILIPVGQKLNRYGNMPKGAIKRTLARKDTFSGKVHGVAGIWKRPSKSQRKSKGPTLLVAYHDRATYTPSLDLEGVATKRGRARFPVHFGRRFKAAMASSR